MPESSVNNSAAMAKPATLAEAVALHRAGHLDAAERVYLELLAVSPDDPDVLHYLGVIAFQRGYFADAVQHISRAIDVWGGQAPAESLVNLGNALKRAGDGAAAEGAYRRAAELRPDFSAAWFNLHLLLEQDGQYDQAAEALRRACYATNPVADALVALGEREIRKGNDSAAATCFERALITGSCSRDALIRVGIALVGISRFSAAVKIFESLRLQGRADVDALNAMGCALMALGRLTDAIHVLSAALRHDPTNVSAIDNLAVAYKDAGRNEESLALYRQAIANVGGQEAGERTCLSNYLMSSLYSDAISGVDLLAIHRQITSRLYPAFRPDTNSATKSSVKTAEPVVLNVGYLSGDLCCHPVAYFIYGVLRHHDHSRVRVFAYHNGPISDDWTDRLKAIVPEWRNVQGMTDSELACQIRADEIHVLIDLSGYTANSRFGVLAHRPATVQANYLGYAFSTGADFVDWRVVDSDTDPLGQDSMASESLWRLHRSYYAYSPPVDAPDVSPLPAKKRGFLTFGVTGNLAKVTARTLDRWGDILRAYPNARLRWRSKAFADSAVKNSMTKALEMRGVRSKRLMLESWAPQHERLRFYCGVDIALDTVPYNQATNTCDALWMGVPTVTWRDGETHQARMGLSILNAAGLGRWAINDVAELHDLLSDQHVLESLRAQMRQRLSGSALLDCADLARQLETAYYEMWQQKSGMASLT